MKTLVLDTSTKYLVIALYQDGHCIESYMHYGKMRQSEDAIPVLERILKQHQWTLKDVDEMIITIGPGSYTGVRVALTIAKTLSVISNVRIKTVSSLQANVGKNTGISIIDARSKKLFIGIYQDGKPLIDETLISIEEFENYRNLYPSFDVFGDTSLVGLEEKEVELYQNIYECSLNQSYIEDIDLLTPTYIKDVVIK